MGVLAEAQATHAGFIADQRLDFLETIEQELADLSAERAGLRAGRDSCEPERQACLARVQRLAAAAARLDLTALTSELSSCEARLLGAGVLGCFDTTALLQIDECLTRLAALVREELAREITPVSGPVRVVHPPRPTYRQTTGSCPGLGLTMLLVADSSFAELLVAGHAAAGAQAPDITVHAVSDATVAMAQAEAVAPDVIILDTGWPQALELVTELSSSAVTDSIPIVALGEWDRPEQAAGLIALGVAKCLVKPVSPSELYQAGVSVAPRPLGAPFEPIGRATLDQLGARLAEELYRGLCDSIDHQLRAKEISFGDGAEVLTTLWGAVAKIRQLVTAQSRGSLRFTDNDLAAAVPQAKISAGRDATERQPTLNEVRREASDQGLAGLTLLVAEDDLSNNWFLSGVLKEAGATVLEALNGRRAINRAFREMPDLILSDIIMPELDGLTLCRAVKRDVALRGTPILLLSWRDDLLQRARELGAGAAGYLLKESSAQSLLRRVQEALRPRLLLAQRIAYGGEVVGRLDGLSTYALLRLTCRQRPTCRLTLRAAGLVYEIDVRGGHPVRVVRSCNRGHLTEGDRAVASLLGEGGGRFVVTDVEALSDAVCEPDLTVEQAIVAAVARARAVQSLLSGTALATVSQVQLEEGQELSDLLEAMPEGSSGLLQALAAGASPRELICSAQAAPELLEHSLRAVLRRGLVRAVHGPDGDDLMAAATARQLHLLQSQSSVDSAGAIAALTAPLPALLALGGKPKSAPESRDEDAAQSRDEDAAQSRGERLRCWRDEGDAGAAPSDPAPEVPMALLQSPCESPSGTGSQLRRPASAGETPILASAVTVAASGSHKTPVLTSTVATADAHFAEPAFGRTTTASEAQAAEPPAEAAPPEPADAASSGAESGSAGSHLRREPEAVAETACYGRCLGGNGELAVTRPPADDRVEQQLPKAPRPPMPSDYATSPHRPPKKRIGRILIPLVFALIGISIAVAARWLRENQTGQQQPLPPSRTQQVVAGPAQAPATSPATADVAVPPAPSVAPPRPSELPEELPLGPKDKAKLAKGEGLLEIVAGRSDKIFINSQLAGQGPVIKKALAAKDEPYEIRVKLHGEERVRYAVVLEGKRIRVRLAPPWRR